MDRAHGEQVFGDMANTRGIIGVAFLCGGGHADGIGEREIATESVFALAQIQEANLRDLCLGLGIGSTNEYERLERSHARAEPRRLACRDARTIGQYALVVIRLVYIILKTRNQARLP